MASAPTTGTATPSLTIKIREEGAPCRQLAMIYSRLCRLAKGRLLTTKINLWWCDIRVHTNNIYARLPCSNFTKGNLRDGLALSDRAKGDYAVITLPANTFRLVWDGTKNEPMLQNKLLRRTDDTYIHKRNR